MQTVKQVNSAKMWFDKLLTRLDSNCPCTKTRARTHHAMRTCDAWQHAARTPHTVNLLLCFCFASSPCRVNSFGSGDRRANRVARRRLACSDRQSSRMWFACFLIQQHNTTSARKHRTGGMAFSVFGRVEMSPSDVRGSASNKPIYSLEKLINTPFGMHEMPDVT